MLSVVENFKTGELELAQLPAPAARPGFVLVANRASLVSAGTEKSAIELGRKSLAGKALARPDLVRQTLNKLRRDGLAATISAVRARLDTPLALGYSSAGVVVEAGRGVEGLSPGDRVACAGARYATHSEFVCVPKNLCVKMPEGVRFEDACYVTLGAVALHAVRLAELALGERAAVIGCGLLGLLTVQALTASGVKVFAADVDGARLELAAALGASATCLSASTELAGRASEFTRGDGFDSVIIAAATASSEPVRLAAALARDRARIVVAGDVGLGIRRRTFYDKELTLVVARSCGPGRYDPNYEERGIEYPIGYVRWGERRNLEEFLSLVACGKVNVKALTTHEFGIDQALRAYDLMLRGKSEPYVGIVLTYAGKQPESRVQLSPRIEPRAGQVGYAIVGAGAFASAVLLPAAGKVKQAHPVAAVSAGGLSAGHAGGKFGFQYAASDFEEVLRDTQVSAVLIATRHNLHAAQVSAALSAGKHVFVEKPLALNEGELAGVADAWRSAGRILMAGFNRRFSPHAAAAKTFFAGTSRPLAVSYRVNAGSLPGTHWVQDVEEGGGRILGEVCHFIDFACFVAGSLPASVFAARCGGAGAAADDCDGVAVTLRFENGSLASIVYVASGEPSHSKERVEIAGAGRTAVIEEFRRTTLYCEANSRVVKTSRQDKGHDAEMAAFFDAVKSGKMPVGFDELCAVTRATFAVEESLRTNAVVSLGNP